MEANQTIVQNAYVVADIHQAIDHWHRTLGVGPFYLVENAPLQTVYRGQPVTLELSVAMVQSGELNIELIQQLNDVPSTYREVYPAGPGGFHHVCIIADDYDGEVERYRAQGFESSLEADMGGYRGIYLDARDAIGCHIEVVEDGPGIRGTYEKIRRGAAEWDGSRLIRPLYPLQED